MYDFAREVEPVLEVLVGKALEIARFELLEEHETEKLHKNKGLFK